MKITTKRLRQLKINDIIEDGDIYSDDNGKTWHHCVAEDFELAVSNSGYDKIRRPI